MQVRPLRKILAFNGTQVLTMLGNLVWSCSGTLSRARMQYFRVSEEWDDYTSVYETKEPVSKAKKEKPKMWKHNGLWHCQYPFQPIRGSGTTQHYAYVDLAIRNLRHVLHQSGATISVS